MTNKLWLSSQDDRVMPHVKLPFKYDFDFVVCNASFWEVFKFVVTFGKRGRLYQVYRNPPPLVHANCRCTINPLKAVTK